MKRSAALAPLSRDHHHALTAAVRLRRASADDLDAAAEHFERFWAGHGRRHFEIEEAVLLPALPEGDPEWGPACARVRAEHADVRAGAAALADPGTPDRLALAHTIGTLLDGHVRFEERELFAMLEARLPDADLERLGAAVEAAEAEPGR